MKIRFKTRKLQKRYERSVEAIRAYGEQVGRKYILRINLIKNARNMDELKKLPALRCHSLKGHFTGLWAIDLTDYYRLIFSLEGETLEIVCIQEVSKHYDE